jgi:mannose-6-phosphate isomerase-like protein (cupin superfamily)
MRVVLYAPRGADPQTPHKQDEVYIVHSGTGTIVKGGETRQFGPGDVIIVEAGAAHHFSFFSDDFVAWAVFWGPEGGE